MSKMDSIVIAVIFYLGWFGSVFLASTEYSCLSLIFPLVLIGFLRRRKYLNLKKFTLAIGLCSIGLVFDALLIKFELISVVGQSILLMPVWLLSIWLSFSFSMIVLGGRLNPPLWLAALLGFIIGPLNYKSGEVFNVLTFTSPDTYLYYAVFWALFFPAVLIFSKRFS
jgi:hypothetical protein